MAEETTTDQATEQSVEDRIAGKFGLQALTEETPAGESQTETVPDFAELDWEGQKIQVPVGLKDAFMRNEDYTKKTQELAEQRRSLDQMRELAQQGQLQSTFIESIAPEQQEIAVIDAYLQQAGKLDWSQMSTDQMLRHKVEIDSIKERRAQLTSSIGEKRAKFTTEMKAKIDELRGKSRELASKSIAGFTEETEKAMRAYAKSEGLSEAELDNVLLDARSYKIIWKAMQFDKVQAGVGKATTAAQKVVRPGAGSERMPQATADKLNFNKAMKQAKTSGEKARVIETRLEGIFAKGRT